MMNWRVRRRNGSSELIMDEPVARQMDSDCTIRPNYIEHRVSKLDTLAGVAIKYGVEVADIKRMNGLVTDLQMFALKTLHIPLPGRHHPSPILSNGSANSGENPSRHDRPHVDVLESFQPLKPKPAARKVSPAMSSLQGYYGLSPDRGKGQAEGMEMAVYRIGVTNNPDKEQLPKLNTSSDPPLARHRKSRSFANENGFENGDYTDLLMCDTGGGEMERFRDLSVRLILQKDSSPDRGPSTPVMILKEDNTSGGFAGITGKGLAQRPKSVSRTILVADTDLGPVNSIPMADLSAATNESNGGVRKSSSTSNLQATDNGTSIWSAPKWSLKTDLQALSAATLARPIFDNLPKPSPARRNKAALD